MRCVPSHGHGRSGCAQFCPSFEQDVGSLLGPFGTADNHSVRCFGSKCMGLFPGIKSTSAGQLTVVIRQSGRAVFGLAVAHQYQLELVHLFVLLVSR